jgi:hypothetical protein
VWTWRELKALGALYLQHGVCIVPALPECVQGIEEIGQKVDEKGGTHMVIRTPKLEPAEEATVVAGFRELAAEDYREILKECDERFAKKIEFERFRGKLTYESTEELREDLAKIHRLYERARTRDWFGEGSRKAVVEALEKCDRLYEAFEEEVYTKADSRVRHAEDPPAKSAPRRSGRAAKTSKSAKSAKAAKASKGG